MLWGWQVKGFCEQQKVGWNNKFSCWVQVTAFVPRMCVQHCRVPTSGRHMWFQSIVYGQTPLLYLHLFLPLKPTYVSSSIPSVLSLLQFFDSSLPLLQSTHFLFIFPISLANIFSTLFHLVLSFFLLSLLNTPLDVLVIQSAMKSLKYFPTGALQLCHWGMYDLPLTSHFFEKVKPKTSPPFPEIWDFICVLFLKPWLFEEC